MAALTDVLAQAQTGAPDTTTLLFGISALVAAFIPMVVAFINRRRGSDDESPAGGGSLLADALKRIALLEANEADCDRQLRLTRTERDTLQVELRIRDRENGELEGLLAEARKKLREREAE